MKIPSGTKVNVTPQQLADSVKGQTWYVDINVPGQLGTRRCEAKFTGNAPDGNIELIVVKDVHKDD